VSLFSCARARCHPDPPNAEEGSHERLDGVP
jgi:hypothetical protein